MLLYNTNRPVEPPHNYNSTKPSDSTLNTDPVAGKKRVGDLVVGSGIALFLCVVPLIAEKIRKPGK